MHQRTGLRGDVRPLDPETMRRRAGRAVQAAGGVKRHREGLRMSWACLTEATTDSMVAGRSRKSVLQGGGRRDKRHATAWRALIPVRVSHRGGGARGRTSRNGPAGGRRRGARRRAGGGATRRAPGVARQHRSMGGRAELAGRLSTNADGLNRRRHAVPRPTRPAGNLHKPFCNALHVVFSCRGRPRTGRGVLSGRGHCSAFVRHEASEGCKEACTAPSPSTRG